MASGSGGGGGTFGENRGFESSSHLAPIEENGV